MAVILEEQTLQQIKTSFDADLVRQREIFNGIILDLPEVTEDQIAELWRATEAEWRMARAQAYREARGESYDQARIYATGKRYLHGTDAEREQIREHGSRLFHERNTAAQAITPEAKQLSSGSSTPHITSEQSLIRHLIEIGERPDRRSWARGPEPTSKNLARDTEQAKHPKRAMSPRALKARQLARTHIAPAGPSLAPIKWLHRHSDGFICFAVKPGPDAWNSLRAIKASALETYLPEIVSQLLQDSFISLNASFCARGREPYRQQGHPLHRLDTLRYLNAVFVDLDYYKVVTPDGVPLSRADVLAGIAIMEEDGTIPPVSMRVDTGCGMWCMWILHHPGDENKSHRLVQSIELQMYSKVNAKLCALFSHLGADSKPSAATHVRMDGSFRAEYDAYVRWDLAGEASSPFRYELSALGDFFDVTIAPRIHEEIQASEQASGKNPNRSRAWHATNDNRLTVMRTLIDARAGGFDSGCRHHGVYLYALALKAKKVPRDKALSQVEAVGRDCRPALSASDCRAAVAEAYKPRMDFNRQHPHSVQLSYQYIANSLAVSPDEASVISQAIGGKDFPPGIQYGSSVLLRDGKGKETKDARVERLRACILEIVAERRVSCPSDPIPSTRLMSKLVRERYGISKSWNTIGKHYPSLGLTTTRQKHLDNAASCRDLKGHLFDAAPEVRADCDVQFSC